MPVKREDAYRALELLEGYCAKLTRPQDKQLRGAIEKVIQIFKSQLFQALIDIQEFYEVTLLDDQKTLVQKTVETNQVATRWERPAAAATSNVIVTPPVKYTPPEEPLPSSTAEVNVNDLYAIPNKVIGSKIAEPVKAEEPQVSVPPPLAPKPQTAPKPPKPQTAAKPQIGNSTEPVKPVKPQVLEVAKDSFNWEHEEIVLERGSSGLGFSIAGGTDSPHVGDDTSIYITKIIDGGIAAADGRLRVNDIIVSVNGMSMIDVTHAESVDNLKKAGKTVKLYVKRPRESNESIMEVVLFKGNKGLGLSIAGGVGNEHIAGDSGIFITKVIDGGAAQVDGRLMAGDRLLMVNDVNLENCDHEFAVATLKAVKEQVKLVISRLGHSVVDGLVTAESVPVNQDTPGHVPPKPKPKTKTKKITSPSSGEVVAAAAAAPLVDATPPSGRRKVVLKKGPSGLGFNIVGGEDGEGIFVSFILPGGPADVSGALFKGDQLLSVNGTDLQDATHEQAAAVLKSAGEVVEIIAQYKPDEFAQFEAKIRDLREQMMNTSTGSLTLDQRSNVYVRALFEYDPAKDSDVPGHGIGFHFGDVLQVVSTSDDEWWQAKLLPPHSDVIGIIPSKQRVERKERARLKSIKSKTDKKKKKKSKADEGEEEKVLSYEVVEQQELKYVRPVILLGQLKDRFNDDLIADFPNKFGSCVPHTTRPRREHEVDGRDYHFVPSREQMERDIENHLFVEAGQFNNNLYGTSIQSVKEVAEQGRHCVLDVSGNAIKRLQAAGIYPIAVFIKPPSVDSVIQWNDSITEDQAWKAYEKTLKTEEEFGELFTAVVSGVNPDDIYEQLKAVVDEHSVPTVWVASGRVL